MQRKNTIRKARSLYPGVFGAFNGVLQVLLVVGGLGCDQEVVENENEVFFQWNARRVLCAASFDSRGANSLASLKGGIERAAQRQEVLVLYGHRTGRDHSMETVEELLAYADERSVETLTMEDLQDSAAEKRAGLMITFDDHTIDEWFVLDDIFRQYGARVTFFISSLSTIPGSEREKLGFLRDAGHAIEAHGLEHRNGLDYSEDRGVQAYVDDEVLPSITGLEDLGYRPRSFAYPYGARRDALDESILQHVDYVRAISSTYGGLASPLRLGPCPTRYDSDDY